MSLTTFLVRLRSQCERVGDAARRLQRRLDGLTDRYQPEFHYMRGLGPKWREKHGAAASTSQQRGSE